MQFIPSSGLQSIWIRLPSTDVLGFTHIVPRGGTSEICDTLWNPGAPCRALKHHHTVPGPFRARACGPSVWATEPLGFVTEIVMGLCRPSRAWESPDHPTRGSRPWLFSYAPPALGWPLGAPDKGRQRIAWGVSPREARIETIQPRKGRQK